MRRLENAKINLRKRYGLEIWTSGLLKNNLNATDDVIIVDCVTLVKSHNFFSKRTCLRILGSRNNDRYWFRVDSPSMKPILTRWGAYLTKRFQPSTSTKRARLSDVATSDKEKQTFFMLMSRTWFKMEEFRLA